MQWRKIFKLVFFFSCMTPNRQQDFYMTVSLNSPRYRVCDFTCQFFMTLEWVYVGFPFLEHFTSLDFVATLEFFSFSRSHFHLPLILYPNTIFLPETWHEVLIYLCACSWVMLMFKVSVLHSSSHFLLFQSGYSRKIEVVLNYCNNKEIQWTTG